MINPTTGSPTITLFQLHSNCRIGLETQISIVFNKTQLLIKKNHKHKFK